MTGLLRRIGVLAAAAASAGCVAAGTRPTPRALLPAVSLPFQDVTASSGLDFELRASRGDRTTILDTIGHGVALLDWDQDGLLDLVLAGPDRVGAFRNRGGFRFQATDLGLRQAGRWGGAAVADVDNNGWPDLFLTGYGCAALYLNEKGRFRDVTGPSGLLPDDGRYPAWGTSAGFADLDADGWADLVVCRYLEFGPETPQRCSAHVSGLTSVCPPKVYAPQHLRVYRGLSGRRFQDVTDAWGLRGHGAALGVAFRTGEESARPTITVANDERPADHFVPGPAGGRYSERGTASGIGYDRQGRVYAGMGLDWGDVDRDGAPDLAGSAFYGEEKPLYLSEGNGVFQESAQRWGISAATLHDVTFGVRFLDYDSDGRLDLMQANGHIQENAARISPEARYAQPLRLFRNEGGRFTPVGAGSWPELVGRGLATGDLDNDGGTDVVVTNLEGQPLLLRNAAPRGRWLGVRLVGRRSNRMALGARVEIQVGGARQAFEVHTAGSYMSASDSRVLAGLGNATGVDRVTVRWPSGARTETRPEGVDRWIELVEPEP